MPLFSPCLRSRQELISQSLCPLGQRVVGWVQSGTCMRHVKERIRMISRCIAISLESK